MDLCRLQENGMYAILTILWCVHDSNLDSALQLPFILHVIMSQNLPETLGQIWQHFQRYRASVFGWLAE